MIKVTKNPLKYCLNISELSWKFGKYADKMSDADL